MRRMLCSLIAALALITAVHATGCAPENAAHAAILMHMDTGKTLYEKNADTRMLIASTTKIMTALVALENCDPKELVRIEPSYCGVEGSSVYLRPGEECTVETLLYGLLLSSGNDAALALAEHVGGSEALFVAMMNDRAAELGLKDTHYSNPHGLDAEDHYSSASDLAKLTCAAMQNELFRQIVSSEKKTCGARVFLNHNRLLRRYDGCFGVKTGYTKAAGRCLVSCAERDGLRLLCVTLSDPRDWSDHAALYDWGFSEWQYLRLFPEGFAAELPVVSGEAETVRVSAAEDGILLPKKAEICIRTELPPFVYADVTAGDTAGRLLVTADGEEVFQTELRYAESVACAKEARLTALERLRRGLERSVRYGGLYQYGILYAP